MPKKRTKPVAEDDDRITVASLLHPSQKRRYIPTAEYRAVLPEDANAPIRAVLRRRNRDLDPQLVWRGKDAQEADELVIQAPALYIQEKVHPKAVIDDLVRHTAGELPDPEIDLFSDFNGIPRGADKTDFYQHNQNWSNRLILGDSLHAMTTLAEKEGLRGTVQCIYMDPPYGIRFNSNFQWSTTTRDVKDGNPTHITREPEQVKAFRDTWRDGVHTYLSYLRDRLTIAHELLHTSGSVFVQIGDENVHRVRAVLDEVFGAENFVSEICFQKTGDQPSELLPNVNDIILWYAKEKEQVKYRRLYLDKREGAVADRDYRARDAQGNAYQATSLTSPRPPGDFPVEFEGKAMRPSSGYWKTGEVGFARLIKAGRVLRSGKTLRYKRYLHDFVLQRQTNFWTDTGGTSDKVYVVQTSTRVVERCILMSTDPGDLVLDPTCGAGTTAYVSEQWGRRWIALDTSRVSLALARARLMGARFPFYLLADSPEGQQKESELSHTPVSNRTSQGDIRHGFVYERAPHITLKAIATNSEIDVIWDEWQGELNRLLIELNKTTRASWRDWEVPIEADPTWSEAATKCHAQWWRARRGLQQELDASIAAKADAELVFDRPYENKKIVRVAGPFTVETLSPHRTLATDGDGAPLDLVGKSQNESPGQSFVEIILTALRKSGVQHVHKDDKLDFETVVPWPGKLVCAEGGYKEANAKRRAAIFIGPEFGTVTRPDLVEAAREAADGGFDVLVACAFNFEAHTTEFSKLGRIPVLKARMNADLHMAEDLKTTGQGNLFVVFGEPDIDLLAADDGALQVKVKGIDIFDPSSGAIRSDDTDGIACWLLDTNYNEESFFVRHAYFLGANDPYKSLRSTLKAQIDEEAWETLHSDISRPFAKPKSRRIAVKVINHLGDEVMKVFKV